VILSVCAASATLAASAAAATTRTVSVGDDYFVRASGVPTVTVRAGDTVRWNWVGRRPHNVRVTSGPIRFGSPTKRSGTFSRVLTRRGTYTIICDIHGARTQQMKLVVR
jgi:plastocyanin